MTPEQAVAEATRVLDGTMEGWTERVDLGELVIKDCEHCVAGQVFCSGPNWDGFEEAMQGMEEEVKDLAFCVSMHAFAVADQLDAAWRKEIQARREA